MIYFVILGATIIDYILIQDLHVPSTQTLYQQSRDKYVEVYTQYEVKKREYLQVTGQ